MPCTKGLRALFSCLFMLFGVNHTPTVHAWSGIDLASAVSCNAVLDPAFYYQALLAYYGPPVRRAGGAIWFRGRGSLYEHEVREVFVATGPAPRFVGVVLEAKPDEVVPAIERARFGSTKMYHDALRQRWVGQDGRVLVWHQGRYAKLYCMGYR